MSWKNLPIEKRKELAEKIAETRKKNGSYKQSKESIEKMVQTSREKGLYDSERMAKIIASREVIKGETKEDAKRRRLDQRIENRTGEKVENKKKGLKKSGSVLEEEYGELLQLLGLKENQNYYKQHPIDSYIVDFYLPAQNLIIEINGCFPHQCQNCGYNKGAYKQSAETIRERDSDRVRYLKSKGYLVHTVLEHELK